VAAGRSTTREIARMMPDVPQATLYRHLAALAKGGLLEVSDEGKIGQERVYALPPGGAVLDPAQLAATTPADHGRYFTAFVSSLLAEFSRYLARDEIDFVADGVGYQQVVLNLDDAEFAEFARRFAELVGPLAGNGPGGGRTPRLLATVLMPVDPPDETSGETSGKAPGEAPDETSDDT
ncbi:transcriptional regulator, partial [Actinomadura sp. CNU-125]|uniref:helix-turn-helix domain-containing protein n=1 Tax=Actinomadura sp. CNU-125 TaxID=1904961 RepID=UPI00095D7459